MLGTEDTKIKSDSALKVFKSTQKEKVTSVQNVAS